MSQALSLAIRSAIQSQLQLPRPEAAAAGPDPSASGLAAGVPATTGPPVRTAPAQAPESPLAGSQPGPVAWAACRKVECRRPCCRGRPDQRAPAPGEAAPQPGAASSRRRRRRVWELNPRWHCQLVGTCLPLTTLRKLAAREGFDVAQATDYALHALAVATCQSRGPLSERIQASLDRLHGAALERFARARTEEAVLTIWRESLRQGESLSASLWAAWSHPDLGDGGGELVYGDIHMLSHQVGAAARADLRRLENLRQDNVQLRNDLHKARTALQAERDQRVRDVAALRQQADCASARALAQEQRAEELARSLQAHAAPACLISRLEESQERAKRLQERLSRSLQACEEARRKRDQAEQRLSALQDGWDSERSRAERLQNEVDGLERMWRESAMPVSDPALTGRCVLCIGGRTGLVDSYRRLVETQGASFLHHDGGREQSMQRLDAALATADAVVCQAGCVSHAAYWKLKNACRRANKPCVFVQSAGMGSFARGLAELTPANGAEAVRFDGQDQEDMQRAGARLLSGAAAPAR